ncbi:MAG: TfoX/Sxy family DNA transformation protein [Pseudomonadota bacterium]
MTALPNLGPKTAAAFARAGLTSAEDIRALGADRAYARLLAAGEPPHFMAFLALVLGLQGRPLRDLPAAERAALRPRFDAVVFDAGDGTSEIEAVLNRLGVPRNG